MWRSRVSIRHQRSGRGEARVFEFPRAWLERGNRRRPLDPRNIETNEHAREMEFVTFSPCWRFRSFFLFQFPLFSNGTVDKFDAIPRWRKETRVASDYYWNATRVWIVFYRFSFFSFFHCDFTAQRRFIEGELVPRLRPWISGYSICFAGENDWAATGLENRGSRFVVFAAEEVRFKWGREMCEMVFGSSVALVE